MSQDYLPPVSFYYTVSLLSKAAGGGTTLDSAFQEVSGISAEQEFEEIKEGGENRFVHKVPGRIKYENLVLKRGLVVWSSPLAQWCRSRFYDGTNSLNVQKKIEPKDIMVQLLDTNSKDPVMSWFFSGAIPVKWEIGALDAMNSKISVETLTLTYQYFKVFNDAQKKYLSKRK